MPDNKFSFTDNRLGKLQPTPGKKRSYFYDTATPGLRVQVTENGARTFQFQVWDSRLKKPVTRTLGKYPSLPLHQARTLAIKELNSVNDGVDIEAAAQAVSQEASFGDVFGRWLEQFAKPHKKSWIEDQRRYVLYMERPFGKKKLSWFNPVRVRQWHHDITTRQKQKGPRGTTITKATANRALALLSTVFNQMAPEQANPCRTVSKYREISRDRFLQPEELKRMFEAIGHPATPADFRDYVLLSLFTGARRANMLAMMWKDINLSTQVWTIPGEVSKNGEAMRVPLVEPAMEILKRRKAEAASMFVLPSKKSKIGHYCTPTKAWESLLQRSGLEGVRIHDLRRTLGSVMACGGSSLPIIGRALGHKNQTTTSVYARLALDPIRAGMEAAAVAMLAAQETPDKVVPLKKVVGK